MAKDGLLIPINEFFQVDPCCILTSTQSYVRLMCKYVNCPFQIWYTYEGSKGGDSTAPRQIKFFRKINNNHSFESHKTGILKEDKKFQML